MDKMTIPLRDIVIDTPKGNYRLMLEKADLSTLYPGMMMYSLRVTTGDRIVGLFRTNSYEYTPTMQLDAETAAFRKAEEWEQSIRADPGDFHEIFHHVEALQGKEEKGPDVVVIQGSPRVDGNSSVLASLAAEEARHLGMTVEVIYPDEMDIRACIGCYQCYNTGTCTFTDDMNWFIPMIRHAALVVVCSPVYTNTVPGGLKILIDRCQAYHAERSLTGRKPGAKGLLFAVAGRKGVANFTCLLRVIGAFLAITGVEPVGRILVDGMDEVRDVRKVAGIAGQVESAVQGALRGKETGKGP